MNTYLCRFCEGDLCATVQARSASEAAVLFCAARPGNIPVPVQIVLVDEGALTSVYRVVDNGWSGPTAHLIETTTSED